MSDFKLISDKLEKANSYIEKELESALKSVGEKIVETAKGKIGQYQPSIDKYPAWKKLKPETVKRKKGNSAFSITSGDNPLIREGKLKEAIKLDDSSISKGEIYIDVKGAEYGIVHEFGSPKKNIPPRPYLRPAIYENKDEIKDSIKNGIKEAMEKLR